MTFCKIQATCHYQQQESKNSANRIIAAESSFPKTSAEDSALQCKTKACNHKHHASQKATLKLKRNNQTNKLQSTIDHGTKRNSTMVSIRTRRGGPKNVSVKILTQKTTLHFHQHPHVQATLINK